MDSNILRPFELGSLVEAIIAEQYPQPPVPEPPAKVKRTDFTPSAQIPQELPQQSLISSLLCQPEPYWDIPDYVYFDAAPAVPAEPVFAFAARAPAHPPSLREHDYALQTGPPCATLDFRACNACNICGDMCADLARHMRSHIMRNDIACLICGEKFLTTTCLNSHMPSHRATCPNCGVKVTVVELGLHEKANCEHRRISTARAPSVRRQYYCIICMRAFEGPTKWLDHLKPNSEHRKLLEGYFLTDGVESL